MEIINISFKTARLAKEKGFNLHTDKCYLIGFLTEFWTDSINKDDIIMTYCPSQSLLQKWLRETHRMDVESFSNASGYNWMINKSFNKEWFSGGTFIKDSEISGPNPGGSWDTYEEALEDGLINALYLI